MIFKEWVRHAIRTVGYDIVPRDTAHRHDLRRQKYLSDLNIDLVLDVGANEGQYGASLRQLGYRHRIVSFEPIHQVFEKLRSAARGDRSWDLRNEALGDADTEADINVAEMSTVSSFLQPNGMAGTGEWKNTSKQTVRVRKLDSVRDELRVGEHRAYLKIDTQGFEENVLNGGRETLAGPAVRAIEAELSIRPFYDNEKLLPDMLELIGTLGFDLVSINPVYVDFNTGYVLQHDCIFVRRDALDRA